MTAGRSVVPTLDTHDPQGTMHPVFSGDAGYRVEGEGNPTLVHSAGWTFRRPGHRQKSRSC